MMRSSKVLSIAGVLLLGCVESQPEAIQGDAQFIRGVPRASADYGVPQGTVTAGSGAPATSVPSEPAAGAVPMAGTGAVAGSAAPTATGAIAGAGGTGTSTGANAGMGASAGGMGGGGAGEAGMTGEPMPTNSIGTLKVSVTTASIGGRYAPKNAGAIWIETGSGQFVKTIERWVGIRVGDLGSWNQASGGWGFSFFGSATSSPDAVDAVSSASLTRHQAHNPTWAMKDVSGMVVPDGAYKVVMEVADGTEAVSEVMFQKGPMPQTVSAPAGGRGYATFTVTYTP